MRKFIHTLLITFCAAFGLTASAQNIESITAPSEISIPVGYSYQIKVVITPSNAANKTLLWQSFDEDIATVSSTGVITGKKKGEVGIWVQTQENEWINAMITVNVTPAGTEPVLPDSGTDPDPGTGGGDNGGNGGDNGGNGGNTGGDTGSTDGKTYTIRLAGTDPALYLTTTFVADGNKGNQTYSLSTVAEGFTLTGDSKNGYYIQSVSGDKAYVGVNTSVAWDCANVQTRWTIATLEGPTTIVQTNATDKGLGCDDVTLNKLGVFTDKNKDKDNCQYYTWYVEELTGTTPETPDPEVPVEPDTKTCAKPVITLADGRISLTCATEGAAITYSVTTPDLSLSGTGTPDLSRLATSLFTLTAKATAEGYNDSEEASQDFTFGVLTSLIGSRGDMNNDGDYTVIDVARLIDHMIDKK